MEKNLTRHRIAAVDREVCVACGACTKACPRKAISIWKGCFAEVDAECCIGCGLCAKICPASCIMVNSGGEGNEK